MSKLETQSLRFSYGGKNILDGVTFSVSAGEAWAVIGRNGAGKTTLLKCLCGLLKPAGGAVLIDGADISKLPPRETALKAAYVPQGHNRTPPPFTVREYVMMARFPYRSFLSAPDKKDRDAVDGALALTDTARLAGRAMNTLSGGELQAALIAGAVAQGTPFLLLDEPTAHLDPCHQENIRRLIERVHTRGGVAVVTVTHDVNLALSTHGHIIALVDGKMFFRGAEKDFCVDAAGNLSKIFGVDFCGIENQYGRSVYIVKGGAR